MTSPLEHVLRTNGSIREFTDQAVDAATITAILDDARFAPSGGNRQPWRVCLVNDVTVRRQLAELMRGVWHEYLGATQHGEVPFAFGAVPSSPPVQAPNELLDAIDRVPVMLVVAADLRRIALMDGGLDRPPVTAGASIYPFCWSILLAARAYGLGGVLTTFLSRAEPAAASLLGLPSDHALAATMFLGHPRHQPTRLRRHPVHSFATLDRFDGPHLGEVTVAQQTR